MFEWKHGKVVMDNDRDSTGCTASGCLAYVCNGNCACDELTEQTVAGHSQLIVVRHASVYESKREIVLSAPVEQVDQQAILDFRERQSHHIEWRGSE